jgi:hypothetical protein
MSVQPRILTLKLGFIAQFIAVLALEQTFHHFSRGLFLFHCLAIHLMSNPKHIGMLLQPILCALFFLSSACDFSLSYYQGCYFFEP